MKINAGAAMKNGKMTITVTLAGLRWIRFRLFLSRLLIYPVFWLFARILGASADIKWEFGAKT